MGIIYNEKAKTFTLHTQNTTYQMQIDAYGFLLHLYYGRKTDGVMDYLLTYADRGFSGNPQDTGNDRTYSLDVLPQEFPCRLTGDFRSPVLDLVNADGSFGCDLRYQGYEICDGKYNLKGLPAVYAAEEEAQTLIIYMKDQVTGLQVELLYGVLPEYDVITRSAKVINTEEDKIRLTKAQAACIDFLHGEFDVISFYGRHAMERNMQRTSVGHGAFVIGSRRGTSSHQYNPFVMLADKNATETSGECYGFSLLYSGNFLAAAEKDQFDQTRLIMGIHPENFEFLLKEGETFWAPEVMMVYSADGFEKMSNCYHKAVREHVCRGRFKLERRPVLINNWEGTYFDFTGDKLLEMAKEAASCGVELFVMDDGWFGKRDDDNSGLGDWQVNEKKLGCTLSELADRIHNLGMKFGIWYEPECISEDSDLYRAHPDWAFTVPGRRPTRGRNQLVLDFSREDVRNHIFDEMTKVLDKADVDYLKWDFNRSISDIYCAVLPAERQGEVPHRYVLGLYEFLDRLGKRYPDMLIEGCSGGGGRFDAGMLHYTSQIWCSDDTDAIERLKIQYGTSFAYPVSAVGSHVSACPNHQTGRIVPFESRATVAMAGTFGYELGPAKLSEEEKQQIQEQIAEFKKYYDVIHFGNYYRLTNAMEEGPYAAWEFAKEDGSEALVSVVASRVRTNDPGVRIKLRGLKENQIYLVNGEEYPGGALMHGGLLLEEAKKEYQSWNYHIVMK